MTAESWRRRNPISVVPNPGTSKLSNLPHRKRLNSTNRWKWYLTFLVTDCGTEANNDRFLVFKVWSTHLGLHIKDLLVFANIEMKLACKKLIRGKFPRWVTRKKFYNIGPRLNHELLLSLSLKISSIKLPKIFVFIKIFTPSLNSIFHLFHLFKVVQSVFWQWNVTTISVFLCILILKQIVVILG
jgi:hypothetical protein